MRALDSPNVTELISVDLSFLVTVPPIRAPFADLKRFIVIRLSECPRYPSPVRPLVDSLVFVFKSDLNIVPVVLVVFIAVNDVVTG